MEKSREDLIKEANELLAQLTPEEAKEIIESVLRKRQSIA